MANRSAGQTVGIQDRSGYIPTVVAALGALALVCERGPVAEARRVDSWPEFQRVYGDHVPGYIGTHEVKRALEGGCAVLVSRVVHYSDLEDATTKASAAAEVTVPDRTTTPGHARVTGSATFPVRLAHGQTLVVDIDGDGDATATFNGFARRLTGSSGTHTAVTAGHALVLTVGGINRTVSFAGTENTALLYAAKIAADVPGVQVDVNSGNVRVTTDKRGSGAALVVHADTASDVLASLGFTSGQVAASLGSSNVADIEAVTALEFKTIVELAVANCTAGADADGHPYIASDATGSGSTVAVDAGSTAAAFGLDNTTHTGVATSTVDTLTFLASSDGAWAHGLRVVIDDATGDQAARFRVRVTNASGVLLEPAFDNLSMLSTDDRYVVNVLAAESIYLRAVDEASATAAPNNRPLAGTYTPAGGDDGLTGLTYDDFVGDSATRTGLHAFDNEANFRLVAMAGQTDHDAHVAGKAYAANLTECRYVGAIPFTITTKANALAFRRRVAPYATGSAIDSPYAALYAGWHRVRDARTRETRWLSGIGEVFAALGAAAKEGGVWLALAGQKRALLSDEVLEVRVKLGPDEVLDCAKAGVNAFYQEPSGPFYIEGQSTLQRLPSATDRLNVCLLTDFISEQARVYNRIDRYDPNDAELWRAIRNRTNTFMEALAAKRGTFEKDARGAARFRVICDDTVNTPEVIAAKQTRLDIPYVAQETSEEQLITLALYASGTPV